MVNLANTDRSRIRWDKYRELVVWCIEYRDYDGEWYGCYGVTLDGEWVADDDKGWLLNVIDQWYEEKEAK